MHGTGASVSAVASLSSVPPPTTRKRHSSRSNSVSSASVVTIKRESFQPVSATGLRSSVAPTRPQSPRDISQLTARPPKIQMSGVGTRRQSAANDAPDTGNSEGVVNLQRWSHSTSSSIASMGQAKRSRPSSGAQQPNLQNLPDAQSSPRRRPLRTGTSPAASPQGNGTASYVGPRSQRRRMSPTPSPERRPPSGHRTEHLHSSLTALPPLHITPALVTSNDTESPSTIQTNTPSTTGLVTPSTHSSYPVDYFVENVSPRSQMKNKKPAMTRNEIAPLSMPHTRLPGSESSHESARQVRQSTSLENVSRPSTARDSERRNSKTRERGEKDKKTMLSRALQKANTAVLLDNAQNFEGALEAYGDACRLLQQVMDRSSTVEDKRKLDAIKVTYAMRIEELHQLESAQPATSDDKDLPARPTSDDSICISPNAALSPISPIGRSSAVIETAALSRIDDVPHLQYTSRDSFLTTTLKAVEGASTAASLDAAPETSRPKSGDMIKESNVRLAPPMEEAHMPPPLSPRRPPPSPPKEQHPDPDSQPFLAHHEDMTRGFVPESEKSHTRTASPANSNGSISWLDTIDESDSSCKSSVHSKSSQQGLRRKNLRGPSGSNDVDFDAAFDAAVEAAYDEGFEPDMSALKSKQGIADTAPVDEEPVLDDADETVLPFEPTAEMIRLQNDLYDQEEEDLLDEITSDYLTQGFDFDLQSKSALPRQSDSSGYSRSTWQSSQVSDRTTAGTSLSTVAEDSLNPRLKFASGTPSSVSTIRQSEPPLGPPPKSSLPRPPSLADKRESSVRNRRLSGQNNLKQLKIETQTKPVEERNRASTFHQPAKLFPEEEETKMPTLDQFVEPEASDIRHQHILQSPPSLNLLSPKSQSSMAPSSAPTDPRESLDGSPGALRSARPNMFRKYKSSLSLKDNTVLLSSLDDSAPSGVTPMSSTFMLFHGGRNQDALNMQRVNLAPSAALTSSSMDGHVSGGAHLFDTSISMAQTLASPRSPSLNSQLQGLEACPESFLLRPFWLMRAISSTLTHPKGGFLTTKLFVPREVWQTRGVKLKSTEEKIANCDLLTAALGRLSGVDTYDADAVMVELQGFEEVMERVQSALVKKLGNDVGVHGIAGLLKDAPVNAAATADATAGAEKASVRKEGKSYLNSWKKLRSKSGKHDKELPPLTSVPMTSSMPVERRGQKRDVKGLVFEGPNKEYMGSLARLFDAAQVLDQIARQVEDPGLKHSSPTHIGLELSIRHAAEFFGFHICRFVLADVGTLIDKYVKRGSEWVLA